jgi:hypothetical protein
MISSPCSFLIFGTFSFFFLSFFTFSIGTGAGRGESTEGSSVGGGDISLVGRLPTLTEPPIELSERRLEGEAPREGIG